VGELAGKIRIADIRPRNLAVHWPEANVLIRKGHRDPSCGEPDYNAVCEVIIPERNADLSARSARFPVPK
jgi:hypothetical protein